jgi:hypothetical protein
MRTLTVLDPQIYPYNIFFQEPVRQARHALLGCRVRTLNSVVGGRHVNSTQEERTFLFSVNLFSRRGLFACLDNVLRSESMHLFR